MSSSSLNEIPTGGVSLDLNIIEVKTEEQLDAVHRIREIVFIIEQNVPRDREYDEYEDSSVHFLAYWGGKPVACIRYRLLGNKVKIERLAVLKEMRGKGIGLKLMKHVEKVSAIHEPLEYTLGSQLYAMEFYEKCGYIPRGPVFLDAFIEHREMYKPA